MREYLSISSRDRDSSSGGASSYTVTLPKQYTDVKSIALRQIEFSNTVPTVPSPTLYTGVDNTVADDTRFGLEPNTLYFSIPYPFAAAQVASAQSLYNAYMAIDSGTAGNYYPLDYGTATKFTRYKDISIQIPAGTYSTGTDLATAIDNLLTKNGTGNYIQDRILAVINPTYSSSGGTTYPVIRCRFESTLNAIVFYASTYVYISFTKYAERRPVTADAQQRNEISYRTMTLLGFSSMRDLINIDQYVSGTTFLARPGSGVLYTTGDAFRNYLGYALQFGLAAGTQPDYTPDNALVLKIRDPDCSLFTTCNPATNGFFAKIPISKGTAYADAEIVSYGMEAYTKYFTFRMSFSSLTIEILTESGFKAFLGDCEHTFILEITMGADEPDDDLARIVNKGFAKMLYEDYPRCANLSTAPSGSVSQHLNRFF